jgi:DNA-binding NarL/FixJ family response regulator
MNRQQLRVLVVDGDREGYEGLIELLRDRFGYIVDTLPGPRQTSEVLTEDQGNYDVALVDDTYVAAPTRTSGSSGVALLKEIKSRYPYIEIIIFSSGESRARIGVDVLFPDAYRYLVKPANVEELEPLIRRAAEYSRLKGVAREKKTLERLMDTSTALLSGRDLEGILDTILEGVRAIGFDRVRLYLLSADKLFMIGRTEVIEDTNRQRDRVNPSMFRNGVRAALCLPLSLRGKRIGVMWIHYDQPHHFPDSEIEALQLYVNQAAIAYDGARRIKELEYMRRAAEALAGVAELPEVLMQIVQSAREVLRADTAFIYWGLFIRYEEELSSYQLVTLIESGLDYARIPDRAGELEDLFRRLFHRSQQITVSRLPSRRDGGLYLAIYAFSETGLMNQYVVACGQRQYIQADLEGYNTCAPKTVGHGHSVAEHLAETVNFAALAYGLTGADLEAVTTWAKFYPQNSGETLKVTIAQLYETTLMFTFQGT